MILTIKNINEFKNEFNNKMKKLFGVDNWIEHWEKYNDIKIESLIGKSISEVHEIISYIDRDYIN